MPDARDGRGAGSDARDGRAAGSDARAVGRAREHVVPGRRHAALASLLALATASLAMASRTTSGPITRPSTDAATVLASVATSRACASPEGAGSALRVVSLVPAASATLDSLGLAECVVGRARDDHGAAVASAPVVGSVLAPDAERVVAARPSLVVVWVGADVRALERRLGRDRLLRLPFERLEHAASGIRAIGRATRHGREAEALAVRLEGRLARVAREAERRAAAGAAPTSVLWAVGYDPPFVAGPGSLPDDLVALAGGKNVFADAVSAWLRPSREELVARTAGVLIWPSGADLPPIARVGDASPWRSAVARYSPDRVLEPDAALVHEAGPGVAAAAELLLGLLRASGEGARADSRRRPFAAGEGPPASRSVPFSLHRDPSR